MKNQRGYGGNRTPIQWLTATCSTVGLHTLGELGEGLPQTHFKTQATANRLLPFTVVFTTVSVFTS